ncbi:MAG: hypothetical protein HY301_00945 [Verrucomicrobia bacterium]|nr:hypothetical protein [Verrucomicrobiota bacterium]
MKPRPALPLILLIAVAAHAEEKTAPAAAPPTFNILAPAQSTPEWKPNAEMWRALSTNRAPGIPLGKSDYTARGPIVEGFRGSKWREVPRRFLSLFVPQKLAKPPGGGGPGYFAWKGESPHAWATVAGGGTVTGHAFTDPRTHEPDYGLISVGK